VPRWSKALRWPLKVRGIRISDPKSTVDHPHPLFSWIPWTGDIENTFPVPGKNDQHCFWIFFLFIPGLPRDQPQEEATDRCIRSGSVFYNLVFMFLGQCMYNQPQGFLVIFIYLSNSKQDFFSCFKNSGYIFDTTFVKKLYKNNSYYVRLYT